MPVTSVHWFRRDLRLTDNCALHHAAKISANVVPVYVLSDWKGRHDWTGSPRQQFLCDSLAALAKNLEAIGSKLIIRSGDAEQELEKVLREARAQALFTNRSPDPSGQATEHKVAAMCGRLGVVFRTFKDCVLHEPDEVLKDDGSPYRVFTPYANNWLSTAKATPLPKARSLGAVPPISSLTLPTLAHWDLPAAPSHLPPAGERAARERMKRFIESGTLASYGRRRDLPFGEHSSMLSPALRHGLIGIRELYQRCRQFAGASRSIAAKSSVNIFMKELAWREFYMAVLHHWPQVLETDFNEDFRDMPWDSPDDFVEAWQQGRTGFPIVDAGMRQLLATGWMHNRVRMIVSMFLTKDLHTHWSVGESFFMQHLVDGEIASNNGGWQWSAGTGADAAPYFRIQNPWTQTKRYDPDGAYIKQWVPELRSVAPARFLEPPGSALAPDYPKPIVDHATQRNKTLARFKQARNTHSR